MLGTKALLQLDRSVQIPKRKGIDSSKEAMGANVLITYSLGSETQTPEIIYSMWETFCRHPDVGNVTILHTATHRRHYVILQQLKLVQRLEEVRSSFASALEKTVAEVKEIEAKGALTENEQKNSTDEVSVKIFNWAKDRLLHAKVLLQQINEKIATNPIEALKEIIETVLDIKARKIAKELGENFRYEVDSLWAANNGSASENLKICCGIQHIWWDSYEFSVHPKPELEESLALCGKCEFKNENKDISPEIRKIKELRGDIRQIAIKFRDDFRISIGDNSADLINWLVSRICGSKEAL